jgi:hypothetical protein
MDLLHLLYLTGGTLGALTGVIYRLKSTVFQITCHAAKRLRRIDSLT